MTMLWILELNFGRESILAQFTLTHHKGAGLLLILTF